MFHPIYYFTRLARISLSILLPTLLVSQICVSSRAQDPANNERKAENTSDSATEEKKSTTNKLGWTPPPPEAVVNAKKDGRPERKVVILSETQDRDGNVFIAIGDVHISDGSILIIADRATYNEATSDVLAEGNVYYEEQGQRLTGDTLEFNYRTKRGVMRNPTGFTNTTPAGVTVVVEAVRAEKTGEDTYNMENAMVTACQQKVPKWSFTAKRARIRVDHRANVYNAFFRIKNIPVIWLPFASIPINKKDRSSGLLTPSSGSSSIKGRTLDLGYYQTLGRSADLLVKGDLYSQRGVGLGFDFRARPDENSHIALGSFMVIDRLLGPKTRTGCDPATAADQCKLPNQGGSSFYAEAVQVLKKGFVAVADVNITSSFDFRNVFSADVLSAISPEEKSDFYINKNWGAYSFNTEVGQQSVFIGASTVKTRQLPSVEFSKRDTQISDKLPFYFSFDTSLDGIQRVETTGTQVDLKTPSIIERLDLTPRLTIPLKSFLGFTLTPSVGVSSTFYSESLDPVKRQFLAQNLLRNYADIDLDLRAPAFARVFNHRDGTPWFKHVFEPYIEYHRITGVDDFEHTPQIDERDLIADTNQVEYGVTNRFFVKRKSGDDSTPQTHELLNLTLSQQYYFDPTFGGALQPGQRNQFFPVNTLSGFAFEGVERDVSPLNLKARLYPVQTLFADLRLNYDTKFHSIRDLIVGMGISKGIFSFSQTYYYTRRIEDDKLLSDKLAYDPTTFPGSQFDFSAFVGKHGRGPYGSFGISYDFRDQTFDGMPRDPHFINFSAVTGWAWDCCGFEIQRTTYNFGIRNESRFVFAFTLKGIGTFGSQNKMQLVGLPRK
ncbi:MAG: LPS-assembly protein LptD [Chloracidobacterium sp.]|nr:LPS-assembly protein LptD [Chloracidobacterium sp.]